MAERLPKNDAALAELELSSSKDISDTPVSESEEKSSSRSGPTFPVVGIVGSAGGLESFKRFFAAMPIDCGMSFVLVPHLDAKRKSSMVELLSRQTAMPVVEAADGTRVEVNSVYIIPHNRCLSLSQGIVRLSDLPEPIGGQTAIDFFLRSLAEDQHERAIGIVFSGTGSHGTLGIREIKRCGGMAMVQSPESAEFDQMPRSAIETGLVDFVLSPESMPETLLKYVKHPYVSQPHSCLLTAPSAAEQLKIVLELIRSQTKYDFRSYRTSMIMRRIERRMGIVQLDDFGMYIELLQSHPNEVDALCKDFLIGVTAFFREPEAFAVLEKELFPHLTTNRFEERPVRVWVPSCATGEEAYSIAILLFEAFARVGQSANIQIFASDINQQSINVARRGIYPTSIATDLSSKRLKRFFIKADDLHYQVSKPLRDAIVFSKQNVISDAPFSKLDLISCRNLLIYLEPEIQQKLIALFHYALVENGHLLLGPAEAIGRSSDLFETVSKQWRVYRRIGPINAPVINLPVKRVSDRPDIKLLRNHSSVPRKTYKELTESTLRDYTPAAVLINRRYEVLYVSGSLVDYLEFPTGELSNDLLSMARAGLRTRLRAACQKAISQRVLVIDNEARVQRNGLYVACTITARPLTDANGSDELALVMLQDRIDGPLTKSIPVPSALDHSLDESIDGSALIQLLEYELKSTREELQNTIEEMESANEELQSSNEELESSKEELQSLNEELTTVNCQLLEKVGELDKSNSEISNMMASTEIATLFLDSQLRIKRFTHPTVALFNLLPTDEGRDIRDFASRITDNKLLEECHKVLQSQQTLDAEILTEDSRCFLRRIMPFRTPDHGTDGLVVTFIDLTARNRAEDALRRSEERIRTILRTASDAIITIDNHGIIDSVNHSTELIFGYTSAELVGRNVNILMPEPFSIEHDGYIQRYLATNEARIIGIGREVVCKRKDGTNFPADLAVSQVDHLGLFTGILRDISSRKEMQRHILEIAADEQRRIGFELHDGTQQELTGLSLYANALQETIQSAKQIDSGSSTNWRFESAEYERLKQTAELLTKRIFETNEHVRNLAHGIMPVQIDAEGLRSALSELANSVNANEEIRCSFECKGEVNFSNTTTATHLYRIAQESVNNALRHGAADRIAIFLLLEGDRIILEVSDNGVGFESESAQGDGQANDGMGMRTMEYRASLIGGRFQILQGPEGGTLVRCDVLRVGSL